MIKRSTWIVLAVFVVALAAAIVIQRQAPETGQEEALPTAVVQPNLLPVGLSDIRGLRLEQTATGQVVELALDESGTWQLLQPPEGEADATLVENSLTTLTNLRVQTALESAVDLAIFGLVQPAYRLRLETAAGETLNLLVGDQTPTANGYYVRLDGALPQVVNKFSLDSFLKLLDEPPLLPTPTPEAEVIEEDAAPSP